VALPASNAVARMLGLLGDEWTLLVLQQALMGATRYGDFRSRLPISHSVLSSRLRSLADNDLVKPTVYQTNPPRSEYLTTARSRSLWPMLVSIWNWE
jgi:DNA-binding HxlR family transcriptional regulator